MKKLILALSCVALVACTQKDSGVRVSAEKPVAPAPAPIAKARSEPIFYNGKTYQLRFAPTKGGAYSMAVGGMSGQQEKDAVAVATSSLRYFACPDGKTGKLTDQPNYVEGSWKMSARCG